MNVTQVETADISSAAYYSIEIGNTATQPPKNQHAIDDYWELPKPTGTVQPYAPDAASPLEQPPSGKSDVFGQGEAAALEDTPLPVPSQQVCVAQAAEPNGLPAELLLGALWPTSTLNHHIGVLDRGGVPQFKNIAVPNVAFAIDAAGKYSAAGADAYFACAEFKSPENRKAENAVQTNAFWLDLDCGEDKAASGKGYASINVAKRALADFCAATGLPASTHDVESGYGLHIYWALDNPVSAAEWTAFALKLKALAKHHGLLADPSRTADISSVLRIPGTQNHKTQPGRAVTLVKAEPCLARDHFLEAINTAYQELCVSTISTTTPPTPVSPSPALANYGPLSLPKLESALMHLDPACDEATWKLKRLAPMANAAREHPAMASVLEDLAKRWSSGELQGKPAAAWTAPGASNGITGESAFATEWARFKTGSYSGKPATLGTIFFDAKQAGWVDMGADLNAPVLADDQALQLQKARQTVQALLLKVKEGDFCAPLEDENATALAQIFSASAAEYQRVRAQLKMANKQVALGAIDMSMKASLSQGATAPTHHGYAKAIIKDLTVGQWAPVGHEGSLYVVNPVSNIWVRKEQGALEQSVAEAHDGNDNCKRRADYAAIALHSVSIVGSERFFADAPVGLACDGSFYRMVGDKPVIEPLTPAHRQRVSLPFTPAQQPTPLFDVFLHETFKSATEGEEAQQIALVQEIAGAVMLGVSHRYQKAALFYDPFGRAGKGTLESILRSLVPPEFVTAVSPFNWHREYHLVSLAGVRLNVVGELPDNEPIPAAIFKSVLGGDLVTGRNPTHRPISFKNEAAHIFTSNHLINSRDQSEAFFARWLVVEFPNSRLRSGLPLDPNLANRIIENELPGIAQWALDGAARLLRNGAFSASAVHERLMLKWRRSNSSLEEFIVEGCELDPGFQMRRSELYAEYKNWCGEAGRKPFAKSRVKELLEHNVGLGITLASLDGYEIFRGLRLKQATPRGTKQ
ncbi:DNA primase family protein [Roseateles toxinivorans]|uniref:P4 family phage/plasmid primase-like protein n=1 Tax=Roseateles toxinivorans TaxID=270368 RepID=A0A4R6QRH2_9BURK|nr:phage/plasmid primase, P4 family [Roseateles toxinivorans]TDP74074.1 P4 family phage/plasmid primase-like protein [Roseateles toxinivorans]